VSAPGTTDLARFLGISYSEDELEDPETFDADGLHPATVLSRRAFFRALAVALAAAGVARLGGSAVAQAMTDAEAAVADGTAAQLPTAERWVMVVDLAKCDGCKQCMIACKKDHHLPDDDQHWIDVWEEEGPYGSFFRPRPCMQCDNSPCTTVCPVGATYTNDNGIVLVDNRKCIGCRMCMVACPYDARYFWWNEPDNPRHLSAEDYTPELTMPHRRGTVGKCVFCADYLQQSRLPRCVQQCPQNALWFGEKTTDVVTNGDDVRRLSELLETRGASRYKEDKGTEPKVFYLPHGREVSP
jgi:dimethyl sulfoxide reductase iron-sulfur subunit